VYNVTKNAQIIDDDDFTKFFSFLHGTIREDVNKYLRIVEIDKNLSSLIENTDNKIFYRPLFFPSIFINNELRYKNKIIKGITIVDLDFYKKSVNTVFSNLKLVDFDVDFNNSYGDYFIYIFMIDKENYVTDFDFFTLNFNLSKSNIEIKNHIRNIICNILDLVEGNDEDLNVVTIETTKSQNIKRIKRDKIPLPTKVFIKPKEYFKRYIKKFTEDLENNNKDVKRKINHKFLVRGHWRHFRSERYKMETRKKSIWIKPFWKGDGISISKEYMLIK